MFGQPIAPSDPHDIQAHSAFLGACEGTCEGACEGACEGCVPGCVRGVPCEGRVAYYTNTYIARASLEKRFAPKVVAAG